MNPYLFAAVSTADCINPANPLKPIIESLADYPRRNHPPCIQPKTQCCVSESRACANNCLERTGITNILGVRERHARAAWLRMNIRPKARDCSNLKLALPLAPNLKQQNKKQS